MSTREERRRQRMLELAEKFRASAQSLNAIASRIHRAATLQQQNQARLERTDERLREHVESDSARVPYTYLEFLEFAHEEFEKFRDQDPVAEGDLQNLDIDTLIRRLQQD